jgi:hypothetical protein
MEGGLAEWKTGEKAAFNSQWTSHFTVETELNYSA